MKILAISGSTRQHSSSRSILEYIKSEFGNDFLVEIFEGLSKLPHFNPDLEKELPTEVVEMRRHIEEADGILFCSPEYVFSLPGSLKNFIEWNVSTVLFSSKPVAIIIAAASGEKAFESLSLILTTLECVLPQESKLLVQGGKGKISGSGQLLDYKLREELEIVMNSLGVTIRDDNRKPSKFQ